jgi:YidC/Oxa1 family membrane protein insertase
MVATVLCVAVSIIFTLLSPPPKPHDQPQLPRLEGGEQAGLAPGGQEAEKNTELLAEEVKAATASAVAAATKPPDLTKGLLAQLEPRPAAREVTIDTPHGRFVLSTVGASLRSYRLKDYPEIDPPIQLLESQRDAAKTPEDQIFWTKRVEELKARIERRGHLKIKKGQPVPEDDWVEMVPTYEDTREYPLALHFDADLSDRDLVYETAATDMSIGPEETAEISFVGRTASGLSITKRVSFSGREPQFEVEVRTEAAGGLKPFLGSLGSQWVLEWPDGLAHLPYQYPGSQEENHLRALLKDSMQSPTARDSLRHEAVKAGETKEFRSALDGRVGWIGIETRYFIATLIPQGPDAQGVYLASDVLKRPAVDTRAGVGLISPLREEPQKFTVYAGPKLTDVLTKLGGGLDRVVYDSWFGSICLLVEWLLAVFYKIIPSYGVAIILLCIFSKVLLYPLTYKQAQTQRKMAELQPKIAELKERFKDDSQKLSQEQMKLWKKHGVNPASGCLPMLAQFPIFIALYRTIQSSIDLRGAPFLWISDLSLPDMTFFVPVNLPFLGNAINILPFIMTGFSLWQMREQKKMMPDPNQAQMMMFMTLFFFFILYHFSSGLVLYWLTNTVTQMIQQKLMEHLGHAATPGKGGAKMAAVLAGANGAEAGDAGMDSQEKPSTKPAAPRRGMKPGKKKVLKP